MQSCHRRINQNGRAATPEIEQAGFGVGGFGKDNDPGNDHYNDRNSGDCT